MSRVTSENEQSNAKKQSTNASNISSVSGSWFVCTRHAGSRIRYEYSSEAQADDRDARRGHLDGGGPVVGARPEVVRGIGGGDGDDARHGLREGAGVLLDGVGVGAVVAGRRGHEEVLHGRGLHGGLQRLRERRAAERAGDDGRLLLDAPVKAERRVRQAAGPRGVHEAADKKRGPLHHGRDAHAVVRGRPHDT